jgi:hypothetical protein
MPALDMAVPHKLSRQEAMTRIRGLLQKLKDEQGDRINDLREDWSDSGGKFSFSAMGFQVSGTLDVTPADVRLSANLPFAASFFKGRIEEAIRARASELLA